MYTKGEILQMVPLERLRQMRDQSDVWLAQVADIRDKTENPTCASLCIELAGWNRQLTDVVEYLERRDNAGGQ